MSKSSGSYESEYASYTSDSVSRESHMMTPPTNTKVKPIVWLFGVIGALGGLTFGFDIGGSGGTFVMPSFRQKFEWDTECMYMKQASVTETGVTQADTINYGFSWMEPAVFKNGSKYYSFDTEPSAHEGGCVAWFNAHAYETDSTGTPLSVDGDGNPVFIDNGATLVPALLESYDKAALPEGVNDETCWTCCCQRARIDDNPEKGFIDDAQSGWITFGETIGCLIGAVPAGWLNNKFGRRTMLWVASLLFCVGAIIQTASNDFTVMMVGRVIGGLGIGNLSAIVPVYLSEIAPLAVRGLFVTMWQFTIVTGILTAGLLNLGFQTVEVGWRFSYGFNMFLSAIMIIGLFKCPESPRFLYFKNKNGKGEASARAALTKCLSTSEEVEWELHQMKIELAQQKKANFKTVFSSKNRNRLRVLSVLFLQLIQQFSGINAIMFFAPTIIGLIEKNPKNILYGNLGIQAVNFASTFITVYAVDKYGRRALMTSGSVICLIGLFAVGFMSAPWGVDAPREEIFIMVDGIKVSQGFPKYPFETNRGLGIGVILMCCVYIVGFAYSWGPVVWIDQAEFFSNETRALGAGLGTVMNWGAASIVAKSFPLMKEKDGMGLHGSFFFFAACLFTGALYSFLVHPETSQVPLEELDNMWNELKFGCGNKTYTPLAQRRLN